MNKVFAIIGPPGSGKSSLLKELCQCGIPSIISHTTRPKRTAETDGQSYYFVDKEAFLKIPFVEKVTYAGHFYGLSKEEVFKKMRECPVSVVDLDLQGLEQLKKALGERIESIFILVDKDTLLSRYVAQGDSYDEIKRRIEQAEKAGEFANWQIANHVIKNTGEFQTVLRQALAILGQSVPAVTNDLAKE